MWNLKYWLWLAGRRGPGHHQIALRLLEHFGGPERVYFAAAEEYARLALPRAVRASLADKSLAEAEEILGRCEALGVRILTIQDGEYPRRLRQIPDPPCVLYVKGRPFSFDEELALGVVGSRRPTPYGVRMACCLGRDLGRQGALVVSGIAQGVDSAALRGALSGGGKAVAVLAGGVDVVYPPQNRDLFANVAAVGALISENPPGTGTEGWRFPVRNRLISGLSLGVVAVEAGEGSGTLITTRLALEQDREVFAFPGPADAPMSRGTNRLIQRGEAKLVLSAADVVSEFSLLFPHCQPQPEALTPEEQEAQTQALTACEQAAEEPAPGAKEVDKAEKRAYITLCDIVKAGWTDDQRDILLALQDGPLSSEELSEAAQVPPRRALSALTMLQLQGYVGEASGKRFQALFWVKRE